MALLIDGVALVTGGGSGIGKEVSLAYAHEGARAVVIADLNHASATATAAACDVVATNPLFKSLPLAVDVSDPASVTAMVDAAVAAFGRIDYSVNSAGVGVRRPLSVEDADLAEMNRFWAVNVMGTLHCIQAVSKVMKAQSVATVPTGRGRDAKGTREVGRGVILNLGSANSFIATPHIVQYSTTKHALMGMTKNAALDLAAHGIRVNAICPSWVDTPMVEEAINGNPELPKMMKSIIPMERIARPEEIADVVMFMTSPRSSYVTGVGWLVDGGTTIQVQTC
ncbi:hypothetical protein B0T17DRAFT_592425 [Bombardia bombarda]|uniref:Uncharacterized protein n=1 Tax=Bombardia bombarda TaxID=252184 RepID=A0AA39WHY1_9PEZI|nr:hypothetical protein B0T17DRAFT_592425 [Bombardia bombarda]